MRDVVKERKARVSLKRQHKNASCEEVMKDKLN